MKTIILTKPYLLFETVNLLYAHVNGIDPSEMTTREPQALRPDQIASLLRQCCDGMDREQPELQYYFKERALEGCDGPYCLAFAMVYSFMLWENPDWQAHLASLEQYWLRMQQIGYLIHSVGTMGLRMEQSPDKQGVPLSSQIYQLGIPAEERLELIEVFTNYSSHLQTLRRLIAPTAEKPVAGQRLGGVSLILCKLRTGCRTAHNIFRRQRLCSLPRAHGITSTGTDVKGGDVIAFHWSAGVRYHCNTYTYRTKIQALPLDHFLHPRYNEHRKVHCR